jgi:hypothetical protein
MLDFADAMGFYQVIPQKIREIAMLTAVLVYGHDE